MIQPETKLSFAVSKDGNGMRRLSRKEILALLDKSEEDIAQGRVYSWKNVREETLKRYGF